MAEQMQYMAKLGIDDSELLRGLGELSQKFSSFFTGATAGLAAVAAAAAYASEQFKEMAHTARKMEELSGATGMSTESLQKFEYAARLAGESTEWYNGTIQKLLTNMGKARDATSDQALAFARLGVKPDGKTVDQVYVEVFEALQKVDNMQERASLSSELLGKSWIEATIAGNHYVENLEKIESKTYFTSEEIKEMAEQQARWNATMADGNLLMQRSVFTLYEVTEKMNLHKQALLGLLGIYDKISSTPAAHGETAAAETPYSREAEQIVSQMSAAEKAGKAEQLKYLNDEYSAGNLTVDQYNAKRLAITGVTDANIGGAVAEALSAYTSGGWDQGMVSGNQYWADGVQPYMGVMGSPTKANAYQLSVAQGLYQKYYDQLTGDKWGPQKNREEIARQMAYNEAAAGYKSEAERNAAVGYNPTGNITIINYNSLTNDETLQALADEISRKQVTKL